MLTARSDPARSCYRSLPGTCSRERSGDPRRSDQGPWRSLRPSEGSRSEGRSERKPFVPWPLKHETPGASSRGFRQPLTRVEFAGECQWLRIRSATRTPFSGRAVEIQLVLSSEAVGIVGHRGVVREDRRECHAIRRRAPEERLGSAARCSQRASCTRALPAHSSRGSQPAGPGSGSRPPPRRFRLRPRRSVERRTEA